MSPMTTTAAALFSMMVFSACDDAATEQKNAVTAQTEADKKIAAANNEAGQKVANAQADAKDKIANAVGEADQKVASAQQEADKKVAAAKENFMKLREEYRHTTQTDLIELDRKVTELEGKAKKSAGRVKTDLQAKVKQLHAKREAFVEHLKVLDTESAVTWDETRARLGKEWSEVTTLLDSK